MQASNSAPAAAVRTRDDHLCSHDMILEVLEGLPPADTMFSDVDSSAEDS